MARLEGVSIKRAGWYYRLMRFLATRKQGAETEPLRVLGHHATIMTASGSYHAIAERANRVPGPLKSLAVIKTAMLVGCHF